MKRWICQILATLVLCVPASHALAQDTVVKKSPFEGTWKFVSWQVEGRQAPTAVLKDFRWTFQGKNAVWSSGVIPETKEKREEKFTFETNPGKSPKQIDLTVISATKIAPFAGIYAFQDGKLTLCLPASAKNVAKGRPSAFEAEIDSGYMLIVLEPVTEK